ncbi:putative ribonuclease H-like domain-containing protein [Tanacetum coccineum]
MRTRSQSRRRRQQQTLPVVENFELEDPIVEQNVVPMADNRTMAQMLQAPIEGLLRQCPHHGFSELHQLDTFYNSLNSNDQDALDSAAGGNFLDKMPQEAKVRKNMCIYLKNRGGYKQSHFKGMSYEDIIPIFERVWDQNHAFVPKDSKIEKEVMMRSGFDLQQESLKQVEKEIVQQDDVVSEQVVKESYSTAKVRLKRKTLKARKDKDKRQKNQDDPEKLTLMEYVEVISNSEEVISVIPLAVKSSIVSWKSYCKEDVGYYEIHRADGSYKTYMFFSEMLNDFDREDLIMLYRLFNEKYASTRLGFDDLMLWGDMKIMFEPNDDDAVWKNHHSQELIEWKLYDSCGVYSLMQGEVSIHMLVEKKYPLPQDTLMRMLQWKLHVNYNVTEMAYELLSTAKRRLILLSEVRDNREKDYLEMKIRRIDKGLGSTIGIRAFALRNFDLEVMEFESAHSNTIAKLPLLKLGEYKMWVIRIKQYFQVQDYALWEVIENGNSWVSVPQTTQENGTSVTKMSVLVTAEENTNKKNDVKARSLLLMALPNEHQLSFSQYTDAKTMFAAIETRFRGNEATKKTQETLLKQQYENFSASSTESFDFIFNRLQKIISRLAILGVVITQEDLNSNFLTSLPLEWNSHVVVWMNKAEIETMSIDDLYNNFKIVEQSVKKSVSTSSGAQNLAFMSAPSTISTNDVNTAKPAYEVSTVSPNVNTAIPQVSTASFSDNAVYAFMVKNPTGSNLLQQNLEQIHKDDPKVMDLKWQLSLLSMKGKESKVECFNCHKMGHFARECRAPRNKEEEQVQTNMALMVFSDSELNHTEEQLVTYRKNEVPFSEKVAILKREVACKDYEINVLKSEFEKVKQEKEGIEFKIEKFNNASKSLNKLLESQITDKSKKGLGYNVVPPPHPLIYNRPKKLNLSYSGLNEFKDHEFKVTVLRIVSKSLTLFVIKKSDDSKENSDDSLVKEQVSEDTSSFVESSFNVEKEIVFLDKKIEFVKPKNHEKPVKKSVSGCSRHMTENIAYLSDFKEFDGGYVTFRGGAHGGRISVTDDYSKFTWVFFLTTKDETSEILKNFIKEIENLVDKKVKIIRSDNGTKFKNKVMDDFCREKVAAGTISNESAGTQGELNAGTDKSKITRIQSKSNKHGHENQKSTRPKPKEAKPQPKP